MPPSENFGALIIGTGQAGPALAHRLAAAGKRVAICERKLFGGTCVNTGCIPTKTMVASAYAAHLARRASDFGVIIPGDVTVDMKKVKARKDAISSQSRTGVESGLRSTNNITVIYGHARFISQREIWVNDRTLSADHIFINVGGRAIIPDFIPADVPYYTNSSIMEVDFLPRHLVIIGASYIGLEFAQMYRRFGSQVTIIEKGPCVAGKEDPDVSNSIQQILEAEGIRFRLDATCISVAKHPDGIVADVDCKDDASPTVGSHLLLAVGRRPNTDDLSLAAAHISIDARGYITVDDELRTTQPHIFALGDCNGKGAFTHTSYNDFEIVAANLLDTALPDWVPRRVSDRITAYNLYTDPPLGRCGRTETEVRATGKPALIAIRPMTRVGRAVEKGESLGFMKILVDAQSNLILGASILGVTGDEVIHCILDTMYARAPYTTLQRAMHIHPTVSELIPTLLGDLKPLA